METLRQILKKKKKHFIKKNIYIFFQSYDSVVGGTSINEAVCFFRDEV